MPAYADFVHLRVHTAYSLAEGAVRIGTKSDLEKATPTDRAANLITQVMRERMPAVAITDTGNLFGALQFSMACAEQGVQPIIGCDLAIRRGEGGARTGRVSAPDRVVLLVQSEAGYRNLMKLTSKAYLETDSAELPQVDIETLETHADGLICLTGGPAGPVGRLLVDNQAPAAEAVLQRLAAAFPGRLYVELMRHGLETEMRIEEPTIALADKYELPLVATNDVYFIDEGTSEAHDVLLCVAEGKHVADPKRRRVTAEHRFKSAAEMRVLFADLPEAIDNTLVVARRCAFMLEKRKPLLPTPPSAAKEGAEAGLRRLAAAGFEKRMTQIGLTGDARKAYAERLDYELNMIVKMGFAGYFLIVADFIQWAKAHDIPVGPGRGSGAGSVVAWALTITDLDPLRFGLLFERFLNPERVSMPDFDIDFCQDRRDEVIKYVQNEYGRDRVAQIITFGKLQARAVLRDVGRVLGMAYGHVDKICKLVPNNPANPVTLQQALDSEPALQEMRKSDEAVAHLMDLAMKLEGLYRHASTHAAGVVIGDRPLDELVPLYRDPRSSMPVTQFNMKYVESAGLVKFDFLGLKTLTVLQRAVDLVRARGIEFDLATLPLDDKPSYDLLAKGDTVGVFQLESSGMRDAMRKMRPDRFEDIIALVALYRPGPMENIPKYIACKHGTEQPDYLHPSLEGILKETFGVIIYQEQVMQIAQVLSGYSLGGADLLRRAMGKKDKVEMANQRATFIKGAAERGVDEAKASQIFDQVDRFAGYGFNKSHAAAYALVAYHTAYLKANYPVEFLAASMTLDLSNTDKLNVFRQEIDRLGSKLLPVDINKSMPVFSVEYDDAGKGAVRYALAAVRNVGLAAMEALAAERSQRGPFNDLNDFAQRLDPKQVNKRSLEFLAKAGAFDTLEPNRARVFASIESILKFASAETAERDGNQATLFAGGAVSKPGLRLPTVPDWPLHERLNNEFESIGFYMSAHPLDAYAKGLERLGVVRSSELLGRLAAGGSARVRLAGTVIGKKEINARNGNRLAFVQMSDAGGSYEVTFFQEVLGTSRTHLESGQPLLISAEAGFKDDVLRITAQTVQLLPEAVASAAAGLKVTINDAAAVPGLRAAIEKEKRGRGRIGIVIDLGEQREVEVALPGFFQITAATRTAMQSLPGVTSVQEI
jgi:DNA polymerase III subunit alpha